MLFGDFYYAILAIHPTDPAIFFTVSSTGDLARYDGNTGTWRTSYGMPGLPSGGATRTRPSPTVKSIALDPQDANVGYVGIESPGNPRHLAVREHPGGVPGLGGHHHGLPPHQHRRPKLWVHPLTGDVFAGTGGVGGLRMLPPPGRRSHPSLIGNWPAL